MRRYLLDSEIANDFINRQHGVDMRADQERHRGNRIGICTPVLGELRAGIEGSSTRDENLRRLRHGLSRLVLWPYDRSAAEEFGRIFAALRRMGRPMQQIDIQIAAIALSLGNTTVVSSDSDLAAVPGLTVENWAAG
ncbi:MAG TPA: type II toxin-antitoxin system VapC family toxin [Gemmataceae bacterium]|nr:type II toxin-antitoxin system VapC family toxin [Gemmataceae bacterium]